MGLRGKRNTWHNGCFMLTFCFFMILSGMVIGQDLEDGDQPSSKLRYLLERYTTDRSTMNRYYHIPMSQTGLNQKKQFVQQWQKTLGEIDFDELGQDGRIDYLLFKNLLDYEFRKIGLEERRNKEDSKLIPFWQTIVTLEDNRRKMEPINSSLIATNLTELRRQVEKAHKIVEAGLKTKMKDDTIEINKTHANRAANKIRRLRRTLKRWFDFYDGYDPLFTWWVNEPYQEVDSALESYTSFLHEHVVGSKGETNSGPIIGDPIGREALLSELDYAMIPYTPEELIGIGKKEYGWCEKEMIRASRELGYGEDWLKALEYVKTLHVDPGKQPYLIRDLAFEAIEFLEEHDLLTIPKLARETWKIEMMSPERQKVNPFFTGGEIIRVSFPTNTMSHEQKLMSMRGNNKHFVRATVHHELIPGHHLQGFMTARYRPYRRIFGTPFWLEGWALHWEMFLWDMDFQKSPENRIGMIFWRMHRCARIIFSLSFHLEKMTAEECIELLVNRVGHELANATAEVRRSFAGGYPPLYQCAYMIGGLQIRALHKELVGSGRMTDREFHDAILKENSIPIEMLRVSLTKQRLRPSFSPEWKFVDK